MKAIYKYDGPLGTYALEEQNGLLTRLGSGDANGIGVRRNLIG